MKNEQIRQIPGFDGRYSITESGTVISHMRNSGRQGTYFRVNRSRDNGNGRMAIGLSIGLRNRKTFKVHRLVCMAFHGVPTTERNEVNHKDGNPKNNHYTNLEWCNRSENVLHAYANGLLRASSGSDHYCAKLSEKDIPVIREMGEAGFPFKHIGAMWGICGRHAQDICERKKWKHVA